jgi:predicted esterase
MKAGDASPAPGYLVHFVHGKESGPWGSKITRLAAIARSHGMRVESLDYAGMADPQQRADRLEQSCRGLRERLILVGSSMGGWVAARASMQLKPVGLFLLAPALYMPGYPPVDADCDPAAMEVVHGWRDEVIPFEHSVRFGKETGCTVHLVDDDHRLHSPRKELDEYFDLFLRRVQAREPVQSP